MSPLFCTVYVSAARQLFTTGELEALLAEAREQNRLREVTGILLYTEGNFMQVLEGTGPALDEVMARVRESRRHSGILTLLREPIAQREFSGWDMAFRRVDRDEFLRLSAGGSAPQLLLRSFLQTLR